jgi:hypothetical protein
MLFPKEQKRCDFYRRSSRLESRCCLFSFAQKQAFAGNLLLLKNKKGKHFWVLSQSAFEALQETQKAILAQEVDFVVAAIPTIEKIGGGSGRCVLAEVLNPKK